MIKSFALLALSITISSCLLGQKKFEVVLSFPDTLNLTDLRIQIDNGLGRTAVQFKAADNNQVMLSDFYYSMYAAVIISLPKTANWEYRNFFFLDEKTAKIKFLPAAKDSSPLDRYVITNAYDFILEKNKLKTYSAAEVAEAEKYYEKYGSAIFDGKHKDLQEEFNKLNNPIYVKDIEYIKKTGNSYFSFWYFRSNVQYSGLPLDSILSIFDNTFPVSFKNSIEGHAFRQLVVGKLETKKGNFAAQFSANDINGNNVTLASFKNKKYVLLDFWATWCVPCIKAMPFLSMLREKYPEQLEIISIAYPTHISLVKDQIAKQKMNWTNIYNDIRLTNSFGGMGAIPKLILIDKSGKIIYDNQKDNDGDLTILVNLLEQNLVTK
jgi:thiol-disulfide isomerase/thioredoxin